MASSDLSRRILFHRQLLPIRLFVKVSEDATISWINPEYIQEVVRIHLRLLELLPRD